MDAPGQLDAGTLHLLRSAVMQIESLAMVRVVLVAVATDGEGNIDGFPHYVATLPREAGIAVLTHIVESADNAVTLPTQAPN